MIYALYTRLLNISWICKSAPTMLSFIWLYYYKYLLPRLICLVIFSTYLARAIELYNFRAPI